jgi:hypothetical protein
MHAPIFNFDVAFCGTEWRAIARQLFIVRLYATEHIVLRTGNFQTPSIDLVSTEIDSVCSCAAVAGSAEEAKGSESKKKAASQLRIRKSPTSLLLVPA